jgi:hypothetical protein
LLLITFSVVFVVRAPGGAREKQKSAEREADGVEEWVGKSEKKSLDTKYVEKVAEPAVDGRSWTHTRQYNIRYIPGHTHTHTHTHTSKYNTSYIYI